MNWQDVLYIRLFDTNGAFLRVDVGIVLVLGMFVGLILFVKKNWRNFLNLWEVEEANIKLGGLGDVKIQPGYEDIQIAHQAWAELSTRKAGLEFNEDHDVIIEVYDSWYKLFGEMRNLVKKIPSKKVRNNKDTQKLVILLVDALNNGLRPHLTKWQSRFRSWYNHEKEKKPGKYPQDIQRDFPEYKKLVSELKEVNKQMVEYTAFIKKIAHGELNQP